jgi:hypothetical protein
VYAYQLAVGVGDDVVAYAEHSVFVPVDTGSGFCDVEFSRVYLGEFDYVVFGYLGCREW